MKGRRHATSRQTAQGKHVLAQPGVRDRRTGGNLDSGSICFLSASSPVAREGLKVSRRSQRVSRRGGTTSAPSPLVIHGWTSSSSMVRRADGLCCSRHMIVAM